MRAEALVGLIAESVRLRVFAAVALGAATEEQVQSMTGLADGDIKIALRRLAEGGLVISVDGRLVVQLGVLQQAAGKKAENRPERVRDAVLRAFIVGGRLVSIPVRHGRRHTVLEHIVTRFEPGVRYSEKEVTAILITLHPDHVALRRHLVDHGLLARESDGSSYWRIGGPAA
jgi:hypothetical protein